MEQLLHYCWKHKLFPLEGLQTTDGQPVEVIDPGLHNLNAGPDFFNAKVKIDGTLWVGNVEIHDKSSDWFAHGHEKDPHYNNTILHVAGLIDCNVRTQSGITPPQVQLSVPDQVRRNYDDLIKTDTYPPCYKIIPSLSRLTVHSWMSALEAERLERKTKDIRWRAEHCDGSWESAYFVTMARNYGFGINSEPMEQWAFAMPLTVVAHHRDDLFQIEALFMGQAGLLNPESIPERHRDAAIADDYFQKMRREYQFLAHKYSLSPIDHRLWRFLRLRPQNFPHIRISQLANLYFQNKTDLSRLAEAETLDAAKEMLATQVTPYWQTHYAFGCERTPWCRCSSPTAATGRTRGSATARSTSSKACAPRTTPSCAHGARWASPSTTRATARRSSSSRKSIATGATACAAASVTNISSQENERIQVSDAHGSARLRVRHRGHCQQCQLPALHRAYAPPLSAQHRQVPLRCDDEMVSCLNLHKEGLRYVFEHDIYRASDMKLSFHADVDLVTLINGKLGVSEDYDKALGFYAK